MERVKPGLTKKLAHRWHGPFRIKKKVEEFAYELELPNRSGYRFYPVVHVSRLKAVSEFGDRPKVRLAPEVDEESRVDFDEELLPEDSWEPDRPSGEFEVEAILDDRTPLSTSTNRAVREFKVKWVGYEETTWEFEVEAILDDRTPLSTSTNRAVREFKVKWVGYEEATWEPATNLSCGGLLYDYLRQKRSDRPLQMAQTADEE
ncbi:hypothetical protein PR002_g30646 [Phytophthora rubi]|uniref:Chromo domain-containing protein n=2 Tax=Phytophthora rubi TaxID=129364 RepID=A0A6A3GQJ7_9STRA|nr:hypothetical protein PR002_g30646 [Phytophthora rubi]